MGRYNKVTIFLLPALLEDLKIPMKELEKYGFIDSYIGDITRTPLEEVEGIALRKPALYLLFRNVEQSRLQEFIEKCEDSLHDEYDYPMGYTVLVFHFPIKHIHNYKMFFEGKYSRFTKEYQNIFPKTPSLEERGTGATKPFTFMVFNKFKALKDALENIIGQNLEEESELCAIYGRKEILDFTIFNIEDNDKQRNTAETA